MNGAARTMAIVGAVVALVTIAAAFVTALALGHAFDSNSTPIAVTIVGVIGTLCTSLLALLAVTSVDRKVNGHLSRLTTIATEAAASSGDPELVHRAAEASADAVKLGADPPAVPGSEGTPRA